jgi:hypothetical protein
VLTKQAQVGDSQITVAETVGWAVGDQLVIGPTEKSVNEHEIVTISDIQDQIVTLSSALKHFHYGAASTI